MQVRSAVKEVQQDRVVGHHEPHEGYDVHYLYCSAMRHLCGNGDTRCFCAPGIYSTNVHIILRRPWYRTMARMNHDHIILVMLATSTSCVACSSKTMRAWKGFTLLRSTSSVATWCNESFGGLALGRAWCSYSQLADVIWDTRFVFIWDCPSHFRGKSMTRRSV